MFGHLTQGFVPILGFNTSRLYLFASDLVRLRENVHNTTSFSGGGSHISKVVTSDFCHTFNVTHFFTIIAKLPHYVDVRLKTRASNSPKKTFLIEQIKISDKLGSERINLGLSSLIPPKVIQ